MSLLDWYDRAGRDLPWRRTRDPYAVWVSEVMLQQTQVATVLPYYERWMTRFPTVESLARAPEEEVMAHWQGLGYYRRCRNLLEGVRQGVANGFPVGHDAWRAMPGVGDYTAAALASILDGEPTPVVDGNVERVYARVCADPSIGDARRKAARAWAQTIISHERPGDWNQAIMELGATVCRPRNPRCAECPLQSECLAFARGLTDSLPTPKPRLATVDRTHPVSVWRRADGAVGMVQAQEAEWWAGLWVLPTPSVNGHLIASVTTTVTHHRVVLSAYEGVGEPPTGLRWVTREELPAVPIPAPFRKLLTKLGF